MKVLIQKKKVFIWKHHAYCLIRPQAETLFSFHELEVTRVAVKSIQA